MIVVKGENMDRRFIKSEAKDVLKGNRFILLLIMLLVGFISGAVGATIIGVLLSPLFSTGLFFVIKNLIFKREVVAEYLYKEVKSFDHAAKICAVGLLYDLIIIVGLILFIVPGYIFMYQYYQATRIIAENPDMKILDALKESKELMMGHKGELFVFHLSFIGHAFLIIITFGLYALYFMPYFATADTNYYLHLTRQKRIEEQKYVENTEYGF